MVFDYIMTEDLFSAMPPLLLKSATVDREYGVFKPNSSNSIMQGLMKLKNNKTCGPDNIAPRLLKGFNSIVVFSIFSLQTSKFGNCR